MIDVTQDILMLARSRPYSNKQKFKAKIPLEHTRLDTAENDGTYQLTVIVFNLY